MLATDPLSLLFLACALFAGLFLVATVALGAGHGHAAHLGGHTAAHAATGAHAAPGHAHIAGHAHAADSHAHIAGHAHAADGQHAAPAPATSPIESVWGAIQGMLWGSLNINGALIFLLVFGVLGYLLHNTPGAQIIVTLLVAALVGSLAAIAVNAALARIFITSQAGELSADSSRLEGKLATVSLAIRAQGIGEVVYTGEAGARHSLGARSADGQPIAAGDQVVIIAAEDGVATVQPWDRFIAETRQRLDADPSAPRLTPGLTPAAPPGENEG